MPLRASVSSSERWGNNSAYLTGLSLPSRLWGPAERGGRRAAAAAVSNLLLRIVSAPLPAAVSKRPRATARLDPRPRRRLGRGPPAPPFERPIQAPAPTPRSPGPRRPGDVLVAAASAVHEGAAEAEGDQDGAAEQQQQPGAHGSGAGQARVGAGHRGGGRPRADSAVSAARRLGPRPGATQHRPLPFGSAPAGSTPPRALHPRQPRLRLRLPLSGPAPAPPRAPPQPLLRSSSGPAQSMGFPPVTKPLLAQTPHAPPPPRSPGPAPSPSSSIPTEAPPRTRCPWQPRFLRASCPGGSVKSYWLVPLSWAPSNNRVLRARS